jgi:N-acyl-D-amino-acid deacylase
MMDEADVRTLVGEDDVLIGSDTIPLPGSPHPRTAGTFARVLGTYVRDERLSDLPRIVRRLTSVPVERFGLGPRGRLAAGLIADVVVFDADGVQDRATYTDPLAPADGVIHVLVGGAAVVRDGRDTGVRPGRLLEPYP